MKIFALNPPFIDRFSRESRSPAVAKSGTLYYPMWLAYSTGYLENQGHEVLLLDAPATGLSMKDIESKIAEFKPQLVIIDTSTPSIYADVETAAAIKRIIPDIVTVLVGAHVSALPVESLELNSNVDAVAFGEYDATLAELTRVLENGRNDTAMRSIAGLAFRASDGTVIKNDPRPFISNLDDFPFVSSVYKKHLDIKPYFYGHSLYPLIVIMTGRGCPFHCTYCVNPQVLQGHTYRKRSIESIVAEFKYIKENIDKNSVLMTIGAGGVYKIGEEYLKESQK